MYGNPLRFPALWDIIHNVFWGIGAPQHNLLKGDILSYYYYTLSNQSESTFGTYKYELSPKKQTSTFPWM